MEYIILIIWKADSLLFDFYVSVYRCNFLLVWCRLLINVQCYIAAVTKLLSGTEEVSTPCQGCGSLPRTAFWLWWRILWWRAPFRGQVLATRSWCTMQAMRRCRPTSSLTGSFWSLDGKHTPAISTFDNTIEVSARLISSPCLSFLAVCAPPTCMMSLSRHGQLSRCEMPRSRSHMYTEREALIFINSKLGQWRFCNVK